MTVWGSNRKKSGFSGSYGNEKGISLTELMVGVGILSIILFVGNALIIDSFKMATRSSAQTTIDSLQMSGIHYARNSERLTESIYNTKGPQFKNCMKKRGSNCKVFAKETFTPLNDVNHKELNGVFSEIGNMSCSGMSQTKECPIRRITRYRMLCKTNSACEGIEILVETTYKNPALDNQKQFNDRRAIIMIPSLALISRAAIDFSCTSKSGKILSAIDYPSLMGLCRPFSGLNSSPAQEPLKIFATSPSDNPADWQALEKKDCPTYGLGTVGLNLNQSVCNGPQPE